VPLAARCEQVVVEGRDAVDRRLWQSRELGGPHPVGIGQLAVLGNRPLQHLQRRRRLHSMVPANQLDQVAGHGQISIELAIRPSLAADQGATATVEQSGLAHRHPRGSVSSVCHRRLGATGSPPSARKGAHDIPSFADLGISKPVVRALARRDATKPIPVQQRVVRDALAGHGRNGRAERRSTGIGFVLADRAEEVRKMAGSLGLARQLGGARKRARAGR
jgi:hypothetical protein